MTSQDSLDQFENSLLTELRAHVSDAELASSKRVSHGWVVGIAAVMVAAVAATLAAISGATSTAYAVEPTPGGDVVVHVYRLEDAAGLQRALARAGVKAMVSYNEAVPSWVRGDDAHPEGVGEQEDDYTPEPGSCTVMGSLGADGLTYRIPAVAVGSDSVFHIAISGSLKDEVSIIEGFDPSPC
ncbi:MAG: hypothetical protein AAGC63_05455 [Propionicimonas sp.]|nr:hypothetical protein [Propionicimonas sp.]